MMAAGSPGSNIGDPISFNTLVSVGASFWNCSKILSFKKENVVEKSDYLSRACVISTIFYYFYY